MRHYSTSQQRSISSYLEAHPDAFTAEEVHLALEEKSIGLATVYRALDRLCEEGVVMKVPSYEGRQARYRYVGTSKDPSQGCMVCLSCGRMSGIECEELEKFVEHISIDHDFKVDTRHTVLYGYCRECEEKR